MIKEMIIEWEVTNNNHWIDNLTLDTPLLNKENSNVDLEFNVTTFKKQITFDKLSDKFFAYLGVTEMIKTNLPLKIFICIILAYSIIPLKIKYFKNEKTKFLFDLFKIEYGVGTLPKKKLRKKLETINLSVNDFDKLISNLKNDNIVIEEDDKYLLLSKPLKSINIL